MDDRAIGATMKTMRIELGLRQAELAAGIGVSRSTVARIEQGALPPARVRTVRALGDALGLELQLGFRRRGADLARLRNARHAALHEAVARQLGELDGWVSAAEVSFSIWGERGVIDRLAWHRGADALVVIELKTALTDLEDLLTTMDRRLRLARAIAAERGWGPDRGPVSAWVVVADTRTNRRVLADHRHLLRSAFRDDGRSVGGWLRDPRRALRCLSFLPIDSGVSHKREKRAPRRPGAGLRELDSRPPEHDPRLGRVPRPRVGVTFRG